MCECPWPASFCLRAHRSVGKYRCLSICLFRWQATNNLFTCAISFGLPVFPVRGAIPRRQERWYDAPTPATYTHTMTPLPHTRISEQFYLMLCGCMPHPHGFALCPCSSKTTSGKSELHRLGRHTPPLEVFPAFGGMYSNGGTEPKTGWHFIHTSFALSRVTSAGGAAMGTNSDSCPSATLTELQPILSRNINHSHTTERPEGAFRVIFLSGIF